MARQNHLEKETPWCTVILCSLCMICHLLVLSGNLATAGSIRSIGRSSRGWSNLGLSMAESFATEINYEMGNMTEQLDDAIKEIVALEQTLDTVIGVMGQQTEQALIQVSMLEQNSAVIDANDPSFMDKITQEIDNSTVPLPDQMKNIVKAVLGAAAAVEQQGNADPATIIKTMLDLLMDTMMQQVSHALDVFLDILEPALLKVGDWYEQFGDKVQAGIEQFSTTIDMVEKMLDQIMAQAGAGGENAEDMDYNTYNLFAVSNKDVGITVQDLQDVSEIYSITALEGSKSEEIHLKYDANQDAVLDKDEYALFTQDPSLPGVMAVVLRSYAKRLSQVAGQLEGARLRDEVANGVVKYLQLVAAKNFTKVEWIADRLTNASVPMAFTADVMRNLALAVDDPEVLTTSDVGALVVGTMSALNSDYTMEAAQLMSDSEFWVSEGFDPADQPTCVERITKWTAASLIQTGSWPSLAKLHRQVGMEEDSNHISLLALGSTTKAAQLIEMTGSSARAMTEENRRLYFQRRNKQQLERHEALTATRGSRYLFDTLFGGQLALVSDPMTTQAVNSGVPAVPETLEFAKFLAWNATDCAQEYQSMCFNYSGMSSTPADAFATEIQGMVKKTQAFMTMLADYAGSEGLDRLRNKTHSFIEDAKMELEGIVISHFNRSVALLQIAQANQGSSNDLSLLEFENERRMEQQAWQPAPGNGAWLEMLNMLQKLQATLPSCVDSLKLARKEVSVVSKTLDSIFDTFLKQGYPIFAKIANRYVEIWVAYFLLLTCFTLGIMYYGFWASGHFGGPKAFEDEEYEPPQTCWERCKCLCSACYSWCCQFSSGESVFWSCLLLGQVFVLLIFIVSLVLTLISGVKMFLASNCAAIYILGDEKTCTETLKMMQGWITTFDAGAPQLNLDQVCVDKDLMTCKIIAAQLKGSALKTIVGAIVASVLSFQLLIESAILHERAHMRRVIDGMLKEDIQAKAEAAEA